ncbi:MAG: exosortase/archaeosortase family protein [Verrucomicrobiota bacterium]|nr:exosortase/archaeosortase family protein [Verrucomicrobiota bacterium]
MNKAQTVKAERPGVWQELCAFWRRLPNKVFFFTLLAAWLALFQFLGNPNRGYFHTSSLLQWMYNAYTGGDPNGSADREGLFIPIVVLGLFWWKRKELLELPLKLWPSALCWVIAGLALHLLAYLIQEPRISIVGMFTGIFGLTGLAWGRAWMRHSLFPFFLFIFCVPTAVALEPITFPLRIVVSAAAQWVAHWVLGINVMRMGTQLFDPMGTYQYDVAAACSGIRSFTAFFLLSVIYGFVVLRAPWKRLFLVALALPFAVLGNLLRMLLIIVAAALGGQEWGNTVHENFLTSLVPYLPAILCLFFAGRWLEGKPEPNPKPRR